MARPRRQSAMVPTDLSGHKVRVRLFGLVELENRWGNAVESTTSSPFSWLLLKYLLVNPGREVPLCELLEHVWTGGRETNVLYAANIRLRRLREALAPLHLDGPEGLILYHDGTYSLNPWFDLETDKEIVWRLMRRIRRVPVDDPNGLVLCARALEIFRGAFMEYTEEVPWLANPRKFYCQEFCALARETLERMRLLNDGRHAALLSLRAAAIVPQEEELHRALVQYMKERGQEIELVRYTKQLARYSRPELAVLQEGVDQVGVIELPREPAPAKSEHEVRVRLFGAVELENSRGCVAENPEWPSLSWLLLKYLLVDPDREVSLDELLQDVWPNEEDVDLKNTVDLRLRRLRKGLAPLCLDGKDGLVLFHDGVFRLNPEYPLYTDKEVFEEQMDRIRETPADDPGGLNICMEALELCRGRFMEHTEEASWLLRLRFSYNLRFYELARSTLERTQICEDGRALELLCRRAAAIIPEQEAFHRELIDYLIEEQRQDELVRYIARLSRRRTPDMGWLEPLEL